VPPLLLRCTLLRASREPCTVNECQNRKSARVREVFLVVKGNSSAAVKAFLAFVKSTDGAKAIKANGLIPKSGI